MLDQTRSIYSLEHISRPVLDDISIVIPTLGRSILEQCLYWIVVGSAWPGNLIVVEQGSNPQVERWLQHIHVIGMQVSHIISNQQGRASGVNRGLELVQTQFIAITDDDCLVDNNWLLNLHNCLQQYPKAIVTGRVEAIGDSTLLVVTSLTPAFYRRPRLKFDNMSGGNMGTSQVVIQQVGLFDEDAYLRTAEDAEWSYRALRMGVPIVYEPNICVHHLGWTEKSSRYEHYQNYARSHGGFYGKYLRRGDLFILVRAIIHHFRALRRWLRGKVKGDADLMLVGKAYFNGLLPGILAGLRSKDE